MNNMCLLEGVELEAGTSVAILPLSVAILGTSVAILVFYVAILDKFVAILPEIQSLCRIATAGSTFLNPASVIYFSQPCLGDLFFSTLSR